MKNHNATIGQVADNEFDVCVIGGGATGLSCALDAQLRGLKTVVVEASDFASGTSTASTKMVHGGVRYLQEAVNDLDVNQYHLVEHALRERLIMLRLAPHLTKTVEFLVPPGHLFQWLKDPLDFGQRNRCPRACRGQRCFIRQH